MTKTETLNAILKEIGELSGLAVSSNDAETTGKSSYLYLEYSSSYGGYRLVNVRLSNGGHFGAFGGNGCEGRLKYAEMYEKLNGILEGLKYSASFK